MLRVRDHEGVIVREDGLGAIVRLTSDPSRLYGYSPTLVVCDELAFWNHAEPAPRLRRVDVGWRRPVGAADVHDHDCGGGLAAARLPAGRYSDSTPPWTPTTSRRSPG